MTTTNLLHTHYDGYSKQLHLHLTRIFVIYCGLMAYVQEMNFSIPQQTEELCDIPDHLELSLCAKIHNSCLTVILQAYALHLNFIRYSKTPCKFLFTDRPRDRQNGLSIYCSGLSCSVSCGKKVLWHLQRRCTLTQNVDYM